MIDTDRMASIIARGNLGVCKPLPRDKREREKELAQRAEERRFWGKCLRERRRAEAKEGRSIELVPPDEITWW